MRLAILLICILFVSCTGVETTSRGLDNQSYLEFFSKEAKYRDGVTVIIDGNGGFKADVKTKTSKRPKGKIYAISPGRHLMEIYLDDDLIIKKELFLSSQQTYVVSLP